MGFENSVSKIIFEINILLLRQHIKSTTYFFQSSIVEWSILV